MADTDTVFNIPPLKGRMVWVDEPYMVLEEGTGAVAFEARASIDLNVVLSVSPASVLPSQDGRNDGAPELELVIGGWLNTKTGFRVDGVLAASITKADDPRAVIQSKAGFDAYWLVVTEHCVAYGKGKVLGEDPLLRLDRPDRLPRGSTVYLGFTTWGWPATIRSLHVFPHFVPFPDSPLLLPRPALPAGRVDIFANAPADSFARQAIAALVDLCFVFPDASRLWAHTLVLAVASPALLGRVFADPEATLPDSLPLAYVGVLDQEAASPAGSTTAVSEWAVAATITVDGLVDALNMAYGAITESDLSPEGRDAASALGMCLDPPEGLVPRGAGDSVWRPALLRTPHAWLAARIPPAAYPPFADAVLELDSGTALSVHRVVLSAWSEYFAIMWTSGFRESREAHVRITDASDADMDTLLHYCYYGTFGGEESLGVHRGFSSSESALDVMCLADRLGMYKVKGILASIQYALLSEENVLDTLYVADLLSCRELLRGALMYVAQVISSMDRGPAYELGREMEFVGGSVVASVLFAAFAAGSEGGMESLSRSLWAALCVTRGWKDGRDGVAASSDGGEATSSRRHEEPSRFSRSRSRTRSRSPGVFSRSPSQSRSRSPSQARSRLEHDVGMDHDELARSLSSLSLMSLARVDSESESDIESVVPYDTGSLQGGGTEEEVLAGCIESLVGMVRRKGVLERALEDKACDVLESLRSGRRDDEEGKTRRDGPFLTIPETGRLDVVGGGKDVRAAGYAAQVTPRGADLEGIERTLLMFSHFGDKNGVVYHYGTGMGTRETFRSPYLRGELGVYSDSPESRYTQRKRLVDRRAVTNNTTTRWWMVDLKEGNRLVLEYYTVRHTHNGGNYLRSWVLEGTMDAALALKAATREDARWVALSVHEDDRTMTNAGQYAGWAVTGGNSTDGVEGGGGFRVFRLRITGPTSDGAHTISMSDLELYGLLSTTVTTTPAASSSSTATPTTSTTPTTPTTTGSTPSSSASPSASLSASPSASPSASLL